MLEHVLRAASRLVKQRDFLVIGSAAILGTYSEDVLPRAANRSEEAGEGDFSAGHPGAANPAEARSAETLERASVASVIASSASSQVGRSFKLIGFEEPAT